MEAVSSVYRFDCGNGRPAKNYLTVRSYIPATGDVIIFEGIRYVVMFKHYNVESGSVTVFCSLIV